MEADKKPSKEVVAYKRQQEVRRQLLAIKLYDKEFESWEKESKRLLKRYRAETIGGLDSELDTSAYFNLYWSNIQTYAPSLYSRTPIVEVSSRNKDDKAPIPKHAAEILERANRFQIGEYDFDAAVSNPVMDLLLCGRGTARIYYEPEIGVDERTGKKVKKSEKVTARYVHWRDFQHNSARTWDEVTEVRFRNYMGKPEVEARFGKDIAKKLKYTYLPNLLEDDKLVSTDEQEHFKKAQVWEVWKKTSKTVCWVSPDYTDNYLDHVDDPLGLKDFLPCPKPLYATLTTESLVPVPDARQVKHLYNRLDNCQASIDALTDDLKVVGIYDAQYEEIAEMLDGNRKMIPIKNYAALQKDGGLTGVAQFWPLDHVVAALEILYRQKAELKADIYEITGFPDIMRGVSDPRETATAQQRKGDFALTRLTNRQGDVQRFARDLIALKGEVIAEHFSPETLLQMTGMEFIPDPPPPQAPPAMPGQPPAPPPQLTPEMIQQQKQQLYVQCCEFLRNDPLRRFKISIETDSTINMDEQAMQQGRSDFLQSVSGFMQAMQPLVAEAPEWMPVFGEMLLFVANTYKPGRNMVASLEQMIEEGKASADAAKNQPPAPDPKVVEVEGKMKLAEMQATKAMELEQVKSNNQTKVVENKALLDQQKAALDNERKIIELQSKLEIERIQMAADIKVQEAKAAADIQLKTLTAQLDALKQEKEVIQKSQGSGGGSSSRGGTNIGIRIKSPGIKKVRSKGPDGKVREFEIEDGDDGELN